MKRQRGRGRKPQHNNNRNFESNGPDIKVRGSASHIYDKYMQLARDATSSGDRVMAEAYYQHAEHYLRIVQANQPRQRDDQQSGGGDQHQNQHNQHNDRGGDSRSQDDHGDQNNRGDDQNRSEPRSDSDDGGRSRSRRSRSRSRSDDQTQSGSDDPLQVVDPEAGSSDASSDQPAAESEAPKRRRGRPRKSESSADAAAEEALKAAETKSDGESGSKSDDAAA